MLSFLEMSQVDLKGGVRLFCNMSLMRKPDFCLCANKGADQLCSNCTADQRLCFRYTDSTIPLLQIAKTSSLWSFSESAQVGLCQTWSETPKTGFLASQLIYRYDGFLGHSLWTIFPAIFVLLLNRTERPIMSKL